MNLLRTLLANKKYFYPALGVVVALAGGAAIWVSNAYTIAVVDGTSIPVSTFHRNYRAASIYYKNIQESYEANDQEAPVMDEKDIKATVLTQLVETVLVAHGAQKEVGDDLGTLVEERIAPYRDDADLASASKTLYGFSSGDFVNEVLVPQAKQDILRGRLFLGGTTLEDWMKETKKTASVAIFSKDFSWNGEEVVVP